MIAAYLRLSLYNQRKKKNSCNKGLTYFSRPLRRSIVLKPGPCADGTYLAYGFIGPCSSWYNKLIIALTVNATNTPAGGGRDSIAAALAEEPSYSPALRLIVFLSYYHHRVLFENRPPLYFCN